MESDILIPDNTTQRALMQSMLLPGENVVHVATLSAGVYWKGIGMLLLALVALFYGFWLFVYLCVIGLGMLWLAYSTKKYLLLAATDHRILITGGILTQEVIQLRYPQIESIDVFYTPPGMLFGYGNILVIGTGDSRWIVPFVRDAENFRDDLTQKMLEYEAPLPHTPPPAPTNQPYYIDNSSAR